MSNGVDTSLTIMRIVLDHKNGHHRVWKPNCPVCRRSVGR